MKASHKRYDSKHKVTRVLLSDYFALKAISQHAGISMAEALHRLIEHQEQLPMKVKPAAQVTSIPTSAVRIIPTPAVRVVDTPAKVMIKSANVKLRVSVAGKENGHVQ